MLADKGGKQGVNVPPVARVKLSEQLKRIDTPRAGQRLARWIADRLLW